MTNRSFMLTTQRLLLRPFKPTDAAAFAALFSDRAARQYTRYGDVNAPEQITTVFNQHFLAHPQTVLAITSKVQGEVIGFFEFHTARMITYLLRRGDWGQGLMTEAGLAAIDYGFQTLGYSQIVGQFAAVNAASGRVLAKLGLQPAGSLGTFTLPETGEQSEVLQYRLTRQEWAKHQE